MQDFDAARERALELALNHHANGALGADEVVQTAQVFLDFLIRETEADKTFRARLAGQPLALSPQD
jgi:hypothetical protein